MITTQNKAVRVFGFGEIVEPKIGERFRFSELGSSGRRVFRAVENDSENEDCMDARGERCAFYRFFPDFCVRRNIDCKSVERSDRKSILAIEENPFNQESCDR